MTTLVVDASILVKVVVDEGDRQVVLDVLGDNPLVAPAFARVELSNILWRKHRLGHVSAVQAEQALEIVERRAVQLFDDRQLLPGALLLAMQIDHPVYDCLYLVAARRAAAALFTADRRLCNAALRSGIEARLPTR